MTTSIRGVHDFPPTCFFVVGHDEEGLFVFLCFAGREASDNIGVVELLSEGKLLTKSGQPFGPEVIQDLNDTTGVACGLASSTR